MDGAQRLVVPVGQYGGAIRDESSDETGYGIRRGHMVISMPWRQVTLWMEAHGRAAEIGTTAWTRSTILDRRDEGTTLEQATTWYTHLLAFRLIREVDADDETEAVEFARTHRLLPAARGKGNTPEDPFRFLAGHPPHRTVSLEWNQVRLWREGYQEPSLWDACLARTAAEERVGYRLDPHRLLAGTLRSLHTMLALRLTYVDLARPAEGAADDVAENADEGSDR
jgi:catechol 2,3-dioxygenase-like lactoylglutathione lyase family enzyme